MKLYHTSGENHNNEIAGNWTGTQADARADRKKMKDDGWSFVETVEIEVPTNKTELLGWLNANRVMPNQAKIGDENEPA